MFKTLFNSSTRNISFKEHQIAIKKLQEICQYEISTMLNSSSEKKHDVILVAIERGGSIPCTILNYSLSQIFKEDLRTGLLRLHNLHVSISTRDKKPEPSTNKRSLATLIKQINEIVFRVGGVKNSKTLRIYFIDDLLDSGATLALLNAVMQKEIWFEPASSSFITCFSRQPLDTYNQANSNFKLASGKILTTSKWLTFWYDNI